MRRDRPVLFKGRHFEPAIIILCVRRYLRYALSLRNLEEIMAERNLQVDHVTIWRWVQDYAPELSRRCRGELRNTNASWRVDETYLRVAGKWTYLYRAVDSTGDTIDFLLSPMRDAAAAKRFLQKALRSPNHPRPRVVNVDGNPAYPRAIDELKEEENSVGAAVVDLSGISTTSLSKIIERSSDGLSHAGLPLLSVGVADDSRYRDCEHDSQGTDSLVTEGRHSRPGRIHH